MTRFTAPGTGISIEKLAFLTYWRQRIAIFNLRGVARVIANRIPICTGDHFPVTFQRFTTIDMGPTPGPSPNLPALALPNARRVPALRLLLWSAFLVCWFCLLFFLPRVDTQSINQNS